MVAVAGAGFGSTLLTTGVASTFPLFAVAAGALLLSSVVPFVRPALAYVRASRRHP